MSKIRLAILITLICLLILLGAGIIINYTDSHQFALFYFPLGILYRTYITVSLIVISLLIFLKANKLYGLSKNKKMAVIAGGFLAGSLLQTQELLFLLNVSIGALSFNSSQVLLYLIGKPWSACMFFTFFFSNAHGRNESWFKKKMYIGFGAYALLIILLDKILSMYFLDYTYLILPNIFLAKITEQALFLLSAFLYTDLKVMSGQRPFSKFTVGLLILGIAPLLFIPEFSSTIYAFISPSIRLIGFTLLFLGLDDLNTLPAHLNFRQRLSAYLSAFVIFSYIIFIPVSSIILGLIFPPISNLIFIVFFVVAAIMQYSLAYKFTNPLTIVTQMVERIKPDQKPPVISVTSHDEIELLAQKINQSAQDLWNNTKREKLIREIIQASRESLDIDQILKTICDGVARLFGAQRVTLTQFPSAPNYKDIIIRQEYKAREDIKSAVWVKNNLPVAEFWGKTLFEREGILIADNLEQSNYSEPFKNFYKDLDVKSIIGVPIHIGNKEWGMIVLSVIDYYRHWTDEEIRLLETIADQANIAIKQAELFNSTKKNAERESLLRHITELIRSSLDINETLIIISNEVAALFKVQRVAISEFTNPKDRSEFIPRREYKENPDIKGLLDIPYAKETGAYIGEAILDKGINLVIDNISEADVPETFKETYILMGVKSALCVPIKQQENEWGTIFLGDYYNYRHWTDDEISLLETIASQIYIAIKQAELFSSIKDKAERETLIKEITNTIRSTLDRQDVKNKIVTSIGKTLEIERCFIHEYDSNINGFLPIDESAEYRSSREIISYIGFTFESELEGSDIIPNALKQGNIIHINDADDFIKEHSNSPFLERVFNEYQIKSALGLPIKYKEQFMGALVFQFQTKKYTFDDEFISLASILADQAGIALYQAKLFEKEQRTANREILIRNITTTIRSTLDLNVIKRTFINEVGSLLDADRSFLSEYDSVNNVFLPVDEHSEYRSGPEIRSMVGDNPEKYKDFTDVLREQQEIIIPDSEDFIQQSPTSTTGIKYLREYNIKSGIGLPIIYGNQILGIFAFHNIREKHNYTEEELTFLRTLATQVGLTFYQAKLFNTVKENAEKERILREIISEIKISEDLDNIYQYLISKLAEIFRIDRVVFIEPPSRKHDKPIIKFEYNTLNITPIFKNMELPDACVKLLQQSISDSKQIVVNDVETADQYEGDEEAKGFFKDFNIKSLLYMPLIKYNHKTETLGVIVMCSQYPRDWSESETSLLQNIASSVVTIVWEIIKRAQIEELRNTFTLTLAHDLQVPLIGEKTALEFLATRPDEQPIGKSKGIILETLNNNQDLFHLLQKLLESYAYESGKKELDLKQDNIGNILIKAKAEAQPKADSKQISINVNIQDNLPSIEMDRAEIHKVFKTLLDNAITYPQEGAHITLEAKTLDDSIIVSVSDDGPGISSDVQEKIFERYAMAVAIERKIGAGLGLYLAKQIVEAHQGKIWFDTEAGKGTAFYFTLPINRGAYE